VPVELIKLICIFILRIPFVDGWMDGCLYVYEFHFSNFSNRIEIDLMNLLDIKTTNK
jgi:hypothetical protein